MVVERNCPPCDGSCHQGTSCPNAPRDAHGAEVELEVTPEENRYIWRWLAVGLFGFCALVAGLVYWALR